MRARGGFRSSSGTAEAHSSVVTRDSARVNPRLGASVHSQLSSGLDASFSGLGASDRLFPESPFVSGEKEASRERPSRGRPDGRDSIAPEDLMRSRFNSSSWRSAAVQIQVELNELLAEMNDKHAESLPESMTPLPRVSSVERVMRILGRTLVGAFQGTGYEKVFRMMHRILDRAVFQPPQETPTRRHRKLRESHGLKVPYFSLLEAARIADDGAAALPPRRARVRQLETTIRQRDDQILDLKHQIADLQGLNSRLKTTSDEQSDQAHRTFRELQLKLKRQTDRIRRMRDHFDDVRVGAGIGADGGEEETDRFRKYAFRIAEFGGPKNLFTNPKHQLKVLRNIHMQLELLENRYIDKFMRRTNPSTGDVGRSVSSSRAGSEFLRDVNLVGSQMNVIREKMRRILKSSAALNKRVSAAKKASGIDPEEDVTASLLSRSSAASPGAKGELKHPSAAPDFGKKATVEELKQWERNATFHPNKFKGQSALQRLNPLMFDNALEIYVSERTFGDPFGDSEGVSAPRFRLLHRQVLSPWTSRPLVLELPHNAESLKLVHSRYRRLPTKRDKDDCPTRNWNVLLPPSMQEEVQESPLVPDRPLWHFYAQKYGEKSVPMCVRSLSLSMLRGVIFDVYTLKIRNCGREKASRKSMMQLLFEYVHEVFVLKEISMKVFYEILLATEKFAELSLEMDISDAAHPPPHEECYLDIRIFKDALIHDGGLSCGRAMSLAWRILNVVLARIGPKDTEEVMRVFYRGTSDSEIMVALQEAKEWGRRMFELGGADVQGTGPKGAFPWSPKRLLQFFLYGLQKGAELWSARFAGYVMEDHRDRSRLYHDEFTEVMVKAVPTVSVEEVSGCFDILLSGRQGHQVDVLELARVFAGVKFEMRLNHGRAQ